MLHPNKKYYTQTADQEDLISIGTIGLVIDSEEDLFEDLSAREMHGKLREIMQQVLTPREREILTLRYGLSNQPPQTQRELAARCGISRSYVSRIEKKALKKLEDAPSPFRPDG